MTAGGRSVVNFKRWVSVVAAAMRIARGGMPWPLVALMLLPPRALGAQTAVRFTDVTRASGLEVWQDADIGGWHGTYVCDYDQDGNPDMFMTSHGIGRENDTGENALFRNMGDGTFRNVLRESGLFDGLHGRYTRELHGAAWFDHDNDGDFDLYYPNTDGFSNDDAHHGFDRVFSNDGHGSFLDVSERLRLPRLDYGRRGCVSLDIEGDGDLDLVFVNAVSVKRRLFSRRKEARHPSEPYQSVYVNRDSHFTLEGRGITHIAWAEGITSCDYDVDGDVDLFIASQTDAPGAPDQIILWENDGAGRFKWNTKALSDPERKMSNGSVTLGDVDNDGDLDLYCMAGLYINQNGEFEFQEGVGAPSEYMFFADLDNDGDLDLVSGGIYWNDGSGAFQHDDAGVNSKSKKGRFARGAIDIDYDNDGDLDIVLNLSDRRQPYLRLYRNDLTTENNWLKVKVRNQSSGQVGCPGAKIWVLQSGTEEILGYKEITTATGFVSGPSYTQHFGLRHHGMVDVKVKLVSGEQIRVSGVAANQVATIEVSRP